MLAKNSYNEPVARGRAIMWMKEGIRLDGR